LAAGNHEQQEGWHLDDTGDFATSQPVIGTNAQKKYYLNPVPDDFYTGNEDTYPIWTETSFTRITTLGPGEMHSSLLLIHSGIRRRSLRGNTGGGESTDTGRGPWDWTLGQTQFCVAQGNARRQQRQV
jgi:hypothetical protein